MRKEFRKIIIGNICYIYPWPVIRGKKYLIEVNIDQADLLIKNILDGTLTSPDEGPTYLCKKGVHKDGFTVIFSIDEKIVPINKKD
jgi:hypothetical protein